MLPQETLLFRTQPNRTRNNSDRNPPGESA
jgi:hypothetical protein